MSRWKRNDSVICRPIFMTGFSAVIGSWKIIAISVPQRLRYSVVAPVGEVVALEA